MLMRVAIFASVAVAAATQVPRLMRRSPRPARLRTCSRGFRRRSHARHAFRLALWAGGADA